jgi:maltose alpha-D-glucosyltransferase/alpha-amylase
VEGTESGRGLLYDALADERFMWALLDAVLRGRSVQGLHKPLVPSRTRALGAAIEGERAPRPRLRAGDQSNTSIVYGDRAVLKIFRRAGDGVNPDLEIGRYLTERTDFAHTPRTLGALEYGDAREDRCTIGILQGWVENEGDAWTLTLDLLQDYLERALAVPEPPIDPETIRLIGGPDPSIQSLDMLGTYGELARLLGERTAELHLALASGRLDPAFEPEPFSKLYQRASYQSMRNTAARSLDLLESHVSDLAPDSAERAGIVLGARERIDHVFRFLLGGRLAGKRTRCHGDYHLGQILYTGRDFVILDFEGEPARPISERRLKRSPLVDVAGMLRSFDYASWYWLVNAATEGIVRIEDVPLLEPWVRLWARLVSRLFLEAYLPPVQAAGLLPNRRAEAADLLHVFMLEKGLYELGYELGHRPAWVDVPLRGIIELIGKDIR